MFFIRLGVLKLFMKRSSIFTFFFLKRKVSPSSDWPVAPLVSHSAVIQGWFKPNRVENAPVQPPYVHHCLCGFPRRWRGHSAYFPQTRKAIESTEMCSSKTRPWMNIHVWEPLLSVWLNHTLSNAFWRHTTRGRFKSLCIRFFLGGGVSFNIL